MTTKPMCIDYRDRYGEHRCGLRIKNPDQVKLTDNKEEVTCGTCLKLIEENSPVIKSQRDKMRDFIFGQNKNHERKFLLAYKYRRQI